MRPSSDAANGVMPMDSYRLAQYAVPVPCYICEGGNNFDAELCRHCQAPIALAHQAETQKVAPQMIATLGSAAAGKTVYLGMLTDMLTRQHQDLKLLTRGAISVSLQQQTTSALAKNRFPGKTPNEPDRWNWVHCQIKSSAVRRPVEMIIPDVSGEAILEEIEHPNSYPVIRAFLQKCKALMVLIDAQKVEEGEQEQDFFTMKIVSYLCELVADPKKGWGNHTISFVFTKTDQCDACWLDPADYARRRTPGLWQLCTERLSKFKFFSAAVAGACAHRSELGGHVQIPLRVEPRGIVEPFQWLIENMGR